MALHFEVVATRHAKSLGFLQIFRPDSLISVEDGPEASISGDGRWVAFASAATDLVQGDVNQKTDVFVRDLQSGTTFLVSISYNVAASTDGDSYSPSLSSDGKCVIFRSTARNLTSGSFTGENLFVRSLETQTNYALTRNGCISSSLSPNGRYMAFVEGGTSWKGYVWDNQKLAKVYTNSALGITSAAVSSDGNRFACQAGSGISSLFVADISAATNWVIASEPSAPNPRTAPRFSGDGSLLAYTWRLNYTNQVFVYDFRTGTNYLISKSYASSGPGNGASESVAISSDGRFIAYISTASDLVPGDENGVPDVFLYDRLTSLATLLSTSYLGSWPGNNRSRGPVFSSGGQTVAFQSWASDLVPGDFNHFSDVFRFRIHASSGIPLFQADIRAGADAPAGVRIFWTASPGKSYRVQFKNGLNAPDWQALDATISVNGNECSLKDLSPNSAQRYYRIVAF